MPSPFPGMDPYLEEEGNWPSFQQQFIATLGQMLLPSLGDRYRVRVATRTYCTEQILFTSIQREQHQEDYLEICARADGRLATLIQLVSPHNRTTTPGRQEYLALRDASRVAGANLLDIELLLSGTPLLDTPTGSAAYDFAVGVFRAGGPDRIELVTATLAKTLPRFKLPLGKNDRDLIVDLGAVLNRAYDLGAFSKRIDYSRNPRVTLRDADMAWLEQLLKAAGLRE